MPSRPDLDLWLEFPYTEHDTPPLRRRIQRDLGYVARRVHAQDPHLVALVLTGGFSRGEGTTRHGEPVNDYDLLAVRERPGGGLFYRQAGLRLTEELGIEIDLLPVWRARLPYVGRKLFWLDVRMGGRIVSGDPDALRRMRGFSATQVSRAEIARLLGNRAAGMLLSLPSEGEPPDPHQRDLQATKAVLAAMDATLIHRSLYTAKMRDRVALTVDHRDHDTFATAVEWKLRPSHPLPTNWWEKSRDALLRAVDETDARRARDGIVEHALHAAKARRIVYSPSQQVRTAAWDLLAISTFPQGPADIPLATRTVRRLGAPGRGLGWAALKAMFITARARTLQ